jgi:hypothetical protein
MPGVELVVGPAQTARLYTQEAVVGTDLGQRQLDGREPARRL